MHLQYSSGKKSKNYIKYQKDREQFKYFGKAGIDNGFSLRENTAITYYCLSSVIKRGNMKFIKLSAFFLLSAIIFPSFIFAADVIFSTTNINDPAAWAVLSNSNGSTGTLTGSFVFTSSQNITQNNITLQSNDGAWKTLTSEGSHRFFNLNGGSTLTLDNIILVRGTYGGDTSGGGGAIYNSGTGLTINGTFAIEASSSTFFGGAIYSASGTVTINGSASFLRNVAVTGHGGAVFSGGSVVLSSGSFLNVQGNYSSLGGGGIYAGSGSVTVGGGANISSNTVRMGKGGGIYAVAGGVYFTDENVEIFMSSNTAMESGGGIYAGQNVVFKGGANLIQNMAFTDESTATFHAGGAIYAGSTVDFENPNVTINLEKNSAITFGGAIYAVSTVTFSGAVNIMSNKVEHSSGGAVYSGDSIVFNNSSATAVISSNFSSYGSGGALFAERDITFSGYLKASNNSANDGSGGRGGAFYSRTLTISDGAEITNNTAGLEGGAVYIHDGTSDFNALTGDILFSNNISSGLRNDVHMGGNAVLNLTVTTSAAITFNGGIKYSTGTAGNVVNKYGSGELYLNGDFDFQTLNITSGTTILGSGSSFEAGNFRLIGANPSVSTGTTTVLDMRNSDLTDKLYISGVLTSTTGGKIYYDIDSNSNASDTIYSYNAYMDGTLIKVGIAGVEAAEKNYNIINSTSGHGVLRIDNTNAEGSEMHRVNSYLTYSDGVEASTTAYAEWKSVNIVLSIDQLNAIAGLTDNQKSVALALDEEYGLALGDLFLVIDSVDTMPDIAGKKKALNSLSGHIYANAITIPALNVSKDSVLSRLKKSYFIPDDSSIKRNIWAQGYIADNKYTGDKNSPGDFSASNSGLQAGFDTMKDDMQIFGLSVGYVNTSAKQNGDTIDITGYNIGGYGAFFFENNFELKLMLIGGRQNYSSSRKIFYGDAINRKTHADFDGYSINTAAELGYDYFYRNDIYFRPFLGLDYSYITTQEFTEDGAGSADLTVYSGSYNRVNSSLGFQINNGIDMRAKWYAEAKLNFLFAQRYGKFEGEFKNTGQPVNIIGIENDLFSTTVGAGVLYDISASWSAYVNVNGLFFGSQRGLYGNMGINYKFTTKYVDFYER